MRRLVLGTAALLLALLITGPVTAATLDFDGAMSIQISALDPITIPTTGVATVNGVEGQLGHLTALAIASKAFVGSRFLEITDPAASPIAAVSATAENGVGSFVEDGFDFGGTMGVPGAARVCLFTSTCTIGIISVPFTSQGKGVGLGGTPVPQVTVSGGGIMISVTGDEWTVGTVAADSGPIDGPFTQQTMMGFAHGPASNGISSVAMPGGVLQLVTPIQINTNIGPSAALPAFTILNLSFAPEPGPTLLVAAAVLTLGVLGTRRARKRD